MTKKGNAKESWNYRTNVFISRASKVMIKILQARLQQYMNRELPHVQAGFRKGRGIRDQVANICWIIKKAREYQKKYLLLLYCLYESLWLCGSQQIGKFFKSWEYQNTFPASWEICMQVKKQQLEPDMKQWTGSKLAKEYVKAIYCHPVYLIYMQSTSWETLGWTRLLGEISITSDMQMTLPLWQKVKRN